MKSTRSQWSAFRGFTLVELMTVIVVLAILMAIILFSIGSWRQRTAESQVKSDLIAASSAMENYRNANNGYPTSVPATFKASSGVTVNYSSGTGAIYCLNGTVVKYANVKFYIRSGSDPQAGTCS